VNPDDLAQHSEQVRGDFRVSELRDQFEGAGRHGGDGALPEVPDGVPIEAVGSRRRAPFAASFPEASPT